MNTNQRVHEHDHLEPERLYRALEPTLSAIDTAGASTTSTITREQQKKNNAVVDAAMRGDVLGLEIALANGGSPSATESTSRSIGMHGRVRGPARSALQLALLARPNTWLRCAALIVKAGADTAYINRWGERASDLLVRRVKQCRRRKMAKDWVIEKLGFLIPQKQCHWFDHASVALFRRLRGEAK